jgi:hypothetical protein
VNITKEFVDDLARVINAHCVENDSNTPDFILAAFAANVIIAYGNALKERKRWYAEDVQRSAMGEPIRAEEPEYLDVRKFHLKFNQVAGFRPQFISTRLAEERFKFMQEELREWWELGVMKGNLAEIADGLIDLVYVAKGTAVMYGLPWRELWDDVHGANMRKVPKITHRGTAHDVGKPEGWVGPQTWSILNAAGFDLGLVWRDVDYPEHGTAWRGTKLNHPELNPGVAEQPASCQAEHGGELPVPREDQQALNEVAKGLVAGLDLSFQACQDSADPQGTPENPIGGVER